MYQSKFILCCVCVLLLIGCQPFLDNHFYKRIKSDPELTTVMKPKIDSLYIGWLKKKNWRYDKNAIAKDLFKDSLITINTHLSDSEWRMMITVNKNRKIVNVTYALPPIY